MGHKTGSWCNPTVTRKTNIRIATKMPTVDENEDDKEEEEDENEDDDVDHNSGSWCNPTVTRTTKIRIATKMPTVMMRTRTVSYTHLTLPTKRIV